MQFDFLNLSYHYMCCFKPCMQMQNRTSVILWHHPIKAQLSFDEYADFYTLEQMFLFYQISTEWPHSPSVLRFLPHKTKKCPFYLTRTNVHCARNLHISHQKAPFLTRRRNISSPLLHQCDNFCITTNFFSKLTAI